MRQIKNETNFPHQPHIGNVVVWFHLKENARSAYLMLMFNQQTKTIIILYFQSYFAYLFFSTACAVVLLYFLFCFLFLLRWWRHLQFIKCNCSIRFYNENRILIFKGFQKTWLAKYRYEECHWRRILFFLWKMRIREMWTKIFWQLTKFLTIPYSSCGFPNNKKII